MENWKRFLIESITSGSQQPTKFTGIIQLQPTDVKYLQQLQQKIIKKYPEQKPVTKLHVTLLHQQVPKKVFSKTMNGGTGQPLKGDKALKSFFKTPEASELQLPSLEFGEIGIKSDGDKTSTFIKINNSEELKTYLKQIYEKVGLDPNEIQKASLAEPRESGPNGEGRIFHISLTNLEGGGGGSIAYIGGGEAIEV